MKRRGLIIIVTLLVWGALLAVSALAQAVDDAWVIDMPSLPHTAQGASLNLTTLYRTDSLTVAEWRHVDTGEVVRAVYEDEDGEPLMWYGEHWFGLPGVWEPLPVPDADGRRDAPIWAAYREVRRIVDDTFFEVLP